MKKPLYFLVLLLAVAILGCKSDKNQETPNKEKAAVKSNVQEPIEEVETTIPWSKFTAGGNEPAWDITIDVAEGGLVYELSLEMGEVVKIGDAEILMYNNDITSVQLDSGNEIVQFQILNKKCTDDANMSFAKSIFFTFGGKTYRGCGKFESEETI